MTDAKENELKPGEMRFVDNYIPSLQAGTYTIEVNQSLKGSGEQNVDEKFEETQEFTVSGPRFRLDPADIYAMYPPPNSQGDFGHDLPHIVLTKRALPWERSLFACKAVPWMALLLFDPLEIWPNLRTNANSTGPTGVTTIQVGAPEPTTEGGKQDKVDSLQKPIREKTMAGKYDWDKLDPEELNQSCQVIDIPLKTFQDVMPSPDEVQHLAHCRILGTNNGATWYSVVVGGRFPSIPVTGEAGKQQVVHLVSLEGFETYLDDHGKFDFGANTLIRLVSLASWVFTCLPAGGDSFRGLMSGLVAEDIKTSLEFRLPLPPQEGTGTTGHDINKDYARSMLEAGYIPCNYLPRQGESTFAWYRGPFTPQPVARFQADPKPYTSAAQAMIYDTEHGLFDMSYAVAWEIGRLLALSDQNFGSALLSWRRKIHRQIDGLTEVSQHDGLQAGLIQGEERQQSLPPGKSRRGDEFVSDLLYLLNTVEPKIFKPAIKPPAESGLAGDQNGSTGADPNAQDQSDFFEKLLSNEDNREKDNKPEFEPIRESLDNLALLVGVPFVNLVADERLLPSESIRFFYLDRNWLEVMQDGALSIGTHSSRDTWFQQASRGFIRSKLHEGPLAGLLLRSAVVSGWPGLEVRAFCNSDGERPSGPEVSILRMDRLSAGVLLCLFDQVPAWVEFNEPRVGLHFGVEVIDGNEMINLRCWREQDVGKLASERLISRRYNRRKLDIRVLLGDLKEKTSLGKESELGPAAFALQMVKVPEQMVFQRSMRRDKK